MAKKKFQTTQIVLPWAPSTNELWTTLRTKSGFTRRVISPKYREFKKLSEQYYLEQNKPKLNIVPDGYILTERIIEFPPDTPWYASRMRNRTQTWDVGNREKATNDVLTELGFWLDDRFVRHIIIEEGELYKDGRILVIFSLEKINRYKFLDCIGENND